MCRCEPTQHYLIGALLRSLFDKEISPCLVPNSIVQSQIMMAFTLMNKSPCCHHSSGCGKWDRFVEPTPLLPCVEWCCMHVQSIEKTAVRAQDRLCKRSSQSGP